MLSLNISNSPTHTFLLKFISNVNLTKSIITVREGHDDYPYISGPRDGHNSQEQALDKLCVEVSVFDFQFKQHFKSLLCHFQSNFHAGVHDDVPGRVG